MIKPKPKLRLNNYSTKSDIYILLEQAEKQATMNNQRLSFEYVLYELKKTIKNI